MTRKEIKRALALLKAEAELGRDPGDLPEGFRESFESQPDFRGWVNYHVTWDLDKDDDWKVVPLEEPLVKVWDREVRSRVPVITPAREIVTPQQYEEMREAGVETLAELEELSGCEGDV